MGSWKKGLRRSGGLRYTKVIGQTDAPVLRLVSYGYSDGFADPDGTQATNITFEMPAELEALPVSRDRGFVHGRENDGHGTPDQATVVLVMDQRQRMSLVRHLLETSMEYDRSYPVTGRSRKGPSFRSRS